MTIDAVDKYGFKPDNSTDNYQAFAAMYKELAAIETAKQPMPRVRFSEGRYRTSVFPNFALHNLDWRGEGTVEFIYTGINDAFVFDGNSNGSYGGGKFNLTIDGIRFVPSPSGGDNLVLKSIHHSNLRVKAYGAGRPVNGVRHRAVSLYWNVATDFYNLTITPFDVVTSGIGDVNSISECIGLWLDTVTTPAHWQTTDCDFHTPIIETCTIGAWLQDAGGCNFINGTIEGCIDTGLHIEGGGQNASDGLWFENNKNWDVSFGPGAHNNTLKTKHPSSLKVQNNSSWFSNNTAT